jgi:hypothetical protein
MMWGSDWAGQAGATLPDVDAACQALRGSVRRTLRWIGPSWRGCLMKRACRELRARMDTEARERLAAGQRWDAVSGPIWVTLIPASRKPPA